MSTTIERFGRELRELASRVAGMLDITPNDLSSVQAPRLGNLGYELRPADASARASWWLIAQWLTAYACGAISTGTRLDEAEDWFYGTAAGPSRRLAPRLPVTLGASAEEVWALLPYLLDPLSQATRRQVLASDKHRPDRTKRKLRGVYYTPADVARFMARRALSDGVGTCLDPACGTGVFLRASLSENREVSPYGLDIDPLAVEMACFVLTADVGASHPSPWAAWHAVRLRFATVDALTVKPGSNLSDWEQGRRADDFDGVLERLHEGDVPEEPPSAHRPYDHLGALFPALETGADAVLCNPPYAALGFREDYAELRARFATFSVAPPSDAGNVFLPFLELGTLLGASDARSAFIVPLSIAHNQGQQFRSVRQSLASDAGALEFYFFDRTPDAIFGDDVKTRAAIVVQDRGAESDVAVTGLTRWTSRSRPQMWDALDATSIGTKIAELIPKLGSRAEVQLYEALRMRDATLRRSVVRTGSVLPSESSIREWPSSVFVAPTAYNWIGCARDLRPLLEGGHESGSSLSVLRFESEELADAAYAIIGSRLAYWLWRVEGDAFHTPKTFLLSLPFALGSLDTNDLDTLAAAGREVWRRASANPVVALNSGRRSVSFTALADASEASSVEALVAELFGLTLEVAEARLADWYSKVVVVDDTETKRRAMYEAMTPCS